MTSLGAPQGDAVKRAGVIGWPVEHSLSPAIHNAAFVALDLDWAYLPLAVPPGALRAAVDGLVALGLPDGRVRGCVRIGLGRGTTTEQIDVAAERIIAEVRAQRAARSSAPAPASSA